MIQKIDNPIECCELKFSSGSKSTFEGYASVFNGTDTDGDTILPGAFSESIEKGRSPAMFVNHDSWSIPVGKWEHLSEDDTGLLVKGRIDMNHRDGPSAYSALKNRSMDGMSIGFRIRANGATDKQEGGGRNISNIDLKEISLVTFPADDNARVSIVKSDIEAITNLKDAELFLRESGQFPRSMATAYVGQLKRIYQSDSENELNEQITKLEAKLKEYEKSNEVHNITDYLVQAIRKL